MVAFWHQLGRIVKEWTSGREINIGTTPASAGPVLEVLEDRRLLSALPVAAALLTAPPRVAAAPVADPPVVFQRTFTVTGVEGTETSVQAVATFTDPSGIGPIENYTADIDWGDGTTPSAGTITVDPITAIFTVNGSHLYKEHGNYTVSVTVHRTNSTDAQTSGSADIADATVLVVVPTLVTNEGATTDVVGTIYDGNPYANPNDFTITINWADGTPTTMGTAVPIPDAPGVFAIHGSHVYVDGPLNQQKLNVLVMDMGGAGNWPDGTTAPINVVNVNPTPLLTGPVTAFVNQPLTFQMGATDPSTIDMDFGFAYTIDWSDGSVLQTFEATRGNGVLQNVNHTFTTPGTYLVKLTATDQDNGSTDTYLNVQVFPMPSVQNLVVNGGNTQRSSLDTVVFTVYSPGMPVPAPTLGSLKLYYNGGREVALAGAGFAYDAATGGVSLDLRSLTLADGDYQLQMVTGVGTTLPIDLFKLSGDVTGDGRVNDVDKSLVKAALHKFTDQNGFNPSADLNSNGEVDANDLSTVRTNFGRRRVLTTASLTITTGTTTRRKMTIPTLNFGTAGVGSASRAIDLVVKNNSHIPMDISKLQIVGNSNFLDVAVLEGVWTRPVNDFTIPAFGTRKIRVYLNASAPKGVASPLVFAYKTDAMTDPRSMVVPVRARVLN